MDISIDVHVYIKVDILYLMHAFDEMVNDHDKPITFDVILFLLKFLIFYKSFFCVCVLCIISSVKLKMGANRNEFGVAFQISHSCPISFH